MTYKEMTAGVQLAGVIAVCAWLGWDALQGGSTGTSGEIAIKLLWAVGAMIVFNIVGSIIVTVVVSAVQRAQWRDEPADERDNAISAKSQRNNAFVTSVLAALALAPVAMGMDVRFALYALFLAPVAGGAINALSELYFYRTM